MLTRIFLSLPKSQNPVIPLFLYLEFPEFWPQGEAEEATASASALNRSFFGKVLSSFTCG